MGKDINNEPFDEGTLCKLEIFENYLREWLPVFIESDHFNKIFICDFFAGSGFDSNQEPTPGSPIRILEQLIDYEDRISKVNINIQVVLNEKNTQKYHLLSDHVNTMISNNLALKRILIEIQNKEFHKCFHEIYGRLKQQPNLLFIDQYGVKEVNDKIFEMIINLEHTDFLFFISSHSMKRFCDTTEFQTHFPDIEVLKVKSEKPVYIHRLMLEYYKNKIPKNNSTRLYPYSIKKGSNIYGLIFGTKHPLGADKFLTVAWDKNRINGEANFDIDEDIKKSEPLLFDYDPNYVRPKNKIEKFEENLEEFIKNNDTITNKDIYEFTLEQGHLDIHAREYLQRLKKEGKVDYQGQPAISYDSCFKKRNIKEIKATTNG